MKWSLSLGRILGIKVFIHWTFVILLGWIFFAQFSSGKGAEQAILSVVFILSLFLCVTLHEYGHALTARRFGIGTKSITLLPIGGLAQLEKMPEKPGEELLVAIAGPLVNVAIALVLFAGLFFTNNMPEVLTVNLLENLQGPGFFLNLLVANIILTVFNLIPAFPMDGGRVLRALLSYKFDRAKATRIAAGIGQFLAIVFVFLGIFYNVWLVLIGIFIYLGAGAEAAFETTKSAMKGIKVSDVLMHKFTLIKQSDSLEKIVSILLDGQEHEFLVEKDDAITGILTRKELIAGLSEHGKSAPVGQVMIKDFVSIKPNMPLEEVYQEMMTKGFTVAPVIDNGKLIGVLNKENIDELLLVKQALANES